MPLSCTTKNTAVPQLGTIALYLCRVLGAAAFLPHNRTFGILAAHKYKYKTIVMKKKQRTTLQELLVRGEREAHQTHLHRLRRAVQEEQAGVAPRRRLPGAIHEVRLLRRRDRQHRPQGAEAVSGSRRRDARGRDVPWRVSTVPRTGTPLPYLCRLNIIKQLLSLHKFLFKNENHSQSQR